MDHLIEPQYFDNLECHTSQFIGNYKDYANYDLYIILHDLSWLRHLDNEYICIIECFIISLLPLFSCQTHKSETNSRSTTK